MRDFLDDIDEEGVAVAIVPSVASVATSLPFVLFS